MIKLLTITLILTLLCLPCLATEQVTFTVKDRFIESQYHSQWFLIIETTDNYVYWISDTVNGWDTLKVSNLICDAYTSFAPNTTHTVQVNGHQVIV